MRIENSFIPVKGVGSKTELQLWKSGVTHWDAFHRDAVGRKTGSRIEAFIEQASDRLDAGDARYFGQVFPTQSHWRLYENFKDEACYLDIETTGLSQDYHEVTVVSLHQAGQTTTLVRGIDLTGERLNGMLEDASLLVTFNGKQFDVPFLEAAYDIELNLPHIDLRYPCQRLGLVGGLKHIEATLGIDREEPDVDGYEAVRLWRAYERGDEEALDTLVRYNRDDTVNMEDLMEHVTNELHREVFERALSSYQRTLER